MKKTISRSGKKAHKLNCRNRIVVFEVKVWAPLERRMWMLLGGISDAKTYTSEWAIMRHKVSRKHVVALGSEMKIVFLPILLFIWLFFDFFNLFPILDQFNYFSDAFRVYDWSGWEICAGDGGERRVSAASEGVKNNFHFFLLVCFVFSKNNWGQVSWMILSKEEIVKGVATNYFVQAWQKSLLFELLLISV